LWLREGAIHVLPRNFYSYMPVNSSLLYAYGLGSLGAWTAQAIHWWCGVLTVLICGCLGRRVFTDGGGWWGATIMATAPATVHLAASGGSDLVVTMYAAGAWLALLRTSDDGGRPMRWWLLAGALAGMAAGTKYTAIGTVILPLAVGGIVLHRPWRRGTMAGLIGGAGVATLGGTLTFGPWILRNLIATGAPLYPFMTGPFRALVATDPETLERFSGWLSGFDLSLDHVVSGLNLGTSVAPPRPSSSCPD
jgi:4-amino-4-deoxy-L-arabinose transferase-like glycosyltransferase